MHNPASESRDAHQQCAYQKSFVVIIIIFQSLQDFLIPPLRHSNPLHSDPYAILH